MYKLAVQADFDSAHCLRHYDGPCANMHGHRWVVEAVWEAEDLNSIGIAHDFKSLKSVLKELLSEFDHICLNEHKAFTAVNPTAENIAKYIYRRLLFHKQIDLGLIEVSVWETPECKVTYNED